MSEGFENGVRRIQVSFYVRVTEMHPDFGESIDSFDETARSVMTGALRFEHPDHACQLGRARSDNREDPGSRSLHVSLVRWCAMSSPPQPAVRPPSWSKVRPTACDTNRQVVARAGALREE